MIAELKRSYRYVRGVSRAVRRGDMFPVAGRVDPQPAPGGSTHSRGGLSLGNEMDRFDHTVHRIVIPGLPRPLRILQLTDLHLRTLDPWTERLAAELRGLQADLVAITGDVVTRGWSREAADLVLSAIPDAPLGRYAIMGNWEYWAGAPPRTWRHVVEAHGITLLRDEHRSFSDFDLIGTDDELAASPDLDAAFAGLDPARPKVVLTHSPSLFPQLLRPGVKLVLAGHTHGGQVRLPFAGPFFLPRGSGPYPWGWYERDGVWLFVSRGIGWSVAPVRWRAAPEIAFIDLVPA